MGQLASKASELTSQTAKSTIPFWKRSLTLNLGIILLALVFLIGLFPEVLARYNPNSHNPEIALQGPSRDHPLGTDNYGRDMLSRIAWGTRVDLQIGMIGMTIPFVTGSTIGLLAGYYGGWIDQVLMRVVDVVVAFPFIVLVIAIVAVLGPGIFNLYLAISFVGWVAFARLIRGEVLVVKNLDYISAARALGYSDARIIMRHVLPNVLGSSVVFAATDVVSCMLAGASMSFLGLGVQPPTPEWGALISDGRVFLTRAWWMASFPGIALAITGTGFSLLGDGLADLLRTKGR